MPKHARTESSSASSSISSPSTLPVSATDPVDEISRSTKFLHVSDQSVHFGEPVIKCSLPPHIDAIPFSSYEDYEIHYVKMHTHRCQACRKNFPTDHYLELHIEENHDPLAEARRARGDKTYRCFVEDCDKICMDTRKRRMHLTDKHMFPKNYDFSIVNLGIDKRSSMLKSRPRTSTASTVASSHNKMEDIARRTEQPQSGDDQSEHLTSSPNSSQTTNESFNAERSEISTSQINSLAGDFSALRFIPPSVRAGRTTANGAHGPTSKNNDGKPH